MSMNGDARKNVCPSAHAAGAGGARSSVTDSAPDRPPKIRPLGTRGAWLCPS